MPLNDAILYKKSLTASFTTLHCKMLVADTRGPLNLLYGIDVRPAFLLPNLFIYSGNIKIYTYSYIQLKKGTLFMYN